ncbi:Protein CBG00198 [Caenorhabditis briggsae]|uniref:Protein CBG00198 n=2 Tax=Caenorhabditis briggsae TaxID=6238 RepID=A8WMG3_CAEBR|nr:Protein CBG00198 [Caenorhabditis briggsae]ULT83622.1 hypothetical protein L3Y34_012688 [Caenorhabditis briggsae]CAP21668.2 Protein CBG00198 [Caenorhabditis briggsae]
MGILHFWKYFTTSSPASGRPRIPSVDAVRNIQDFLAANSEEGNTEPEMNKKQEKKDKKEERGEPKKKLLKNEDTLTMKQTQTVQGKDHRSNNQAGNLLTPVGNNQRMRNGNRVATFEASGNLPSIPRPTCPPPAMAASIPRATQPPPGRHFEPEPTRRERLGSITSRFPQFWRSLQEQSQPRPPITRLPGTDEVDTEATLEPLWETRDSNNERFSFPYMVGSLRDVLDSEKKKKEEKRGGQK